MQTTQPVTPSAARGQATAPQATLASCVSAVSWSDAIQAAAAVLAGTAGPVVALARLQGKSIALAPVGAAIPEEIHDALGRAAESVFRNVDGWVLANGAYAVRSIAVRKDGEAHEALVGIATSEPSPGHLAAVAAALSSASAREVAQDARVEADTAGHVIDLTDRLQEATDTDDLYRRLAESVRVSLNAEAVVVGQRGRDHFELVANAPETPLTDEERTAVASALDELALLGEPIAWPPKQSIDRPARRAIERAFELRRVSAAWAIPLEDASGQIATALFVWGPEGDESLNRLVAYWTPSVGSTVTTLREARATWWERLKSLLHDGLTGRGTRIAIGCTVLVAAVLAVPLPYEPKCDCLLEPAERRFVAAPFASTLKTVYVEPGDVVTEDAVLAELDEREIEWDLASIQAELLQAEKRRTAALADANLAEAQIAEFEKQKLAARRDLLESRRGKLQVRAPLSGIVVEGDLARAEGMPLELGQTLYEIAPLTSFVCEIHVPEFDIEEVAVGQSVTVSLDARPDVDLSGTIRRIRPRAETHDGGVVFVAEVELANVDGTLRPGMSGDARVTTNRHPLGWNLIHRAYGQWRRGW